MKTSLHLKLTVFASLLCVSALVAQDEKPIEVVIVQEGGWGKPIPVNIAGFSQEVDAIMKFDLTFMGFEFVPHDKARYLIEGKVGPGRVEGIVTDPFSRQAVLAKAFTGAAIRQQTHALADEIAKKLTGKPGIAQTKIAFVGQPSDVGPGEVYIADFDGHNAQRVTQDGVIVAAPAWGSPSTLFYTSYKFNKPDIFSQNLATGARKAVARFNGLNSSAAVSSDGNRLAMVISKTGNPEIWVSDLIGGGLRQLTTGRGVVASPCWSPDSRTICFCSDRSGAAALYTVPAAGGTASRLPTAGANRPTEPDWSPDGRFVVFTTQRRGGFDICYVPMEGPRRGQTTTVVEGEDPVWAPNSRAVIFTRNVNHRHVLSLLDVPTKQVKDIARISGSASQPSWGR